MSEICIERIVIVGGGTAGWMTAALLNRFLPPERCRVTLVESAEVGIIGVGEATVPPLVSFLKAIGVDEDEFMVATHASYKLGIRFQNWVRGEESFWHPFGVGGGQIDRLQVFQHWLKSLRTGQRNGPYDSYSLQAVLGEMNRAPRHPGGSSPVMQQRGYAYHLDAREFAAFLSRLCVQRGVRRVVDNVCAANLDERGYVRGIQTTANGTLEADLFIDCTGFAGLLIERALGDPYVSWSDHLLCDRALALPLPQDPEMAPYTRATALSAGWVWRIPLSHRVGSGYVFSSRFISDEAAAGELLAHAGQDPDRAEPRLLRMRIGRRSNFWVKNCVAIGLSAGFLEPLESTGIFLIQKGAEALLENFPDRQFAEPLARRYNRQIGAAYDEVRDFIILHYILTQRDDSAFWKANRELPVPDSLAETLELYDHTGICNWENRMLFAEPSFYAIVAGFGRLPKHHQPMADFSREDRVVQILDEIRAQNLRVAQGLPDHGDFMRALHLRQ